MRPPPRFRHATPNRQTILTAGQSELVLVRTEGPDPVQYRVEFNVEGSEQIEQIDTDLTAALIEQPVARWRVAALRAATVRRPGIGLGRCRRRRLISSPERRRCCGDRRALASLSVGVSASGATGVQLGTYSGSIPGSRRSRCPARWNVGQVDRLPFCMTVGAQGVDVGTGISDDRSDTPRQLADDSGCHADRIHTSSAPP